MKTSVSVIILSNCNLVLFYLFWYLIFLLRGWFTMKVIYMVKINKFHQ